MLRLAAQTPCRLRPLSSALEVFAYVRSCTENSPHDCGCLYRCMCTSGRYQTSAASFNFIWYSCDAGSGRVRDRRNLCHERSQVHIAMPADRDRVGMSRSVRAEVLGSESIASRRSMRESSSGNDYSFTRAQRDAMGLRESRGFRRDIADRFQYFRPSGSATRSFLSWRGCRCSAREVLRICGQINQVALSTCNTALEPRVRVKATSPNRRSLGAQRNRQANSNISGIK